MPQSQLLHRLPRHLRSAGRPLYEDGAGARDRSQRDFIQRAQNSLLRHPHAAWLRPAPGRCRRGQRRLLPQRGRGGRGGGGRRRGGRRGRREGLELGAHQESQSQVTDEDEEGQKDPGREESGRAGGVRAMHSTAQVCKIFVLIPKCES